MDLRTRMPAHVGMGTKFTAAFPCMYFTRLRLNQSRDCCAVGLQNATVLKGKWLWMPMSSCQRACNSCEYLRPLRSEVQQQIVDTGKLCLQMKHCVHLTAAPMSADARLSPWQCLLFSRTAPCRTLHLLTLHQS